MEHFTSLINHPLINEWDYNDVINLADKEKLVNHQYKGVDNSLFYEYAMSPLCQKIVDEHLPETIA